MFFAKVKLSSFQNINVLLVIDFLMSMNEYLIFHHETDNAMIGKNRRKTTVKNLSLFFHRNPSLISYINQ